MEEVDARDAHRGERGAHDRESAGDIRWLVGESFSAADIVVFPGIQMLLRALERREAQELRSRFLPLESELSRRSPLDQARRSAAGLRAHRIRRTGARSAR